MEEELLDAIFTAILDGDIPGAPGAVQAALDAGLNAEKILNEGMIASMNRVGELYECGDYYVAEMFTSAKALQAALGVLRPHLQQSQVQSAGTVVIGTVKGDMHDIGKNLVTMMLEGAGFTVHDLGPDVHPSRFVSAVLEHRPEIVALSALLTTTMPAMKTTIDALVAAGLRAQVKIIVGGAPVNDEYARHISADGYAPDASQAVSLARTLMVN
ncbi:MAG: corrinoid protein [Caldilineaceae bacterium]|nr:corrinoid protein [Caldilineaceae bacterium]